MKLILIVLTLIPFNIYSQNINIKYESGLDSLIMKNNTIQQKKEGVSDLGTLNYRVSNSTLIPAFSRNSTPERSL